MSEGAPVVELLLIGFASGTLSSLTVLGAMWLVARARARHAQATIPPAPSAPAWNPGGLIPGPDVAQAPPAPAAPQTPQ